MHRDHTVDVVTPCYNDECAADKSGFRATTRDLVVNMDGDRIAAAWHS